MVCIDSRDDFVERSVQLFKDNPESSRYVMNYRHCDGKLVLKVTDNCQMFSFIDLVASGAAQLRFDMRVERMDLNRLLVDVDAELPSREVLGWETTVRLSDDQCLKFKTDQAQDAKKMEKLNNIFFTLMARGPNADAAEVTGKEQVEQQAIKKGHGRRQ